MELACSILIRIHNLFFFTDFSQELKLYSRFAHLNDWFKNLQQNVNQPQ